MAGHKISFRKHLKRIMKHLHKVGDDLPISGMERDAGCVPLTDFDIIIDNQVFDLDAPLPDWCSPDERAAIYRSILCMREGYVYLDWDTVMPADVPYSIESHNN